MSLKQASILFASVGGIVCLLLLVALLVFTGHDKQVNPDTASPSSSGQPGAEMGTESPTAPLIPFTRRQLVDRGNEYGRNGDWQKAYECFRQVVADGTRDEWEWSWATGSSLGAGDTNACVEYCGKMLLVIGNNNDASVAERCAKQCLAFNSPDALLRVATERADFAITRDRKSRWAQLVKGMAEYRAGNWAGALEWLRGPESSSDLEISLQACCFGALARQQLGDAPGARHAVAEADRRIWVLNWTGELGHQQYNTWDNIARAMFVRAEAEQVINGKSFVSPLAPAIIPVNRRKWQAMTRNLEVAEQLAKQAAWPPARDYYSTALHDAAFDWRVLEVKHDFLVQQMAAVFLMAEDQDRYRELVQAILERKLENLSPYTQERWAQVCVTCPDQLTPEMKTRAFTFARQVYEKPGAASNPWLVLVRGMAEYREGRFAEAIVTLGQAAFQPTDSIARAKAVTFQGMAHKRLGHAQEATQAMQEAQALFARPTSRNSFWPHTPYYQLAMQELMQMLSGSEQPVKMVPGTTSKKPR